MDDDDAGTDQAAFRVSFVPGVMPDRWFRTWRQRSPRVLAAAPTPVEEQLSVLHEGRADMCFVRLPVDRASLHVIPLYREVPVVVVGREHPVAAYDEIPVADLADEHLLQDPDEVPEWSEVAAELRDGTRHPVPPMSLRDAVATVAAGTGIVIVPKSLARLHHRKDVVAVPVLDVAESEVGLAWRTDNDDPDVETFIGIVRGRTEHSSRGSTEGVRRDQPGGGGSGSGGRRAGDSGSGRGGRSGRTERPRRSRRRR